MSGIFWTFGGYILLGRLNWSGRPLAGALFISRILWFIAPPSAGRPAPSGHSIPDVSHTPSRHRMSKPYRTSDQYMAIYILGRGLNRADALIDPVLTWIPFLAAAPPEPSPADPPTDPLPQSSGFHS